MKTVTTVITVLFISLNLSAQSEIYFQKMGEALAGFSTIESSKDYISVASNFERISNVETEQWLPLYYHAQCFVLMSFVDQDADGEKKDSYLDIAEASINKMIVLVPEESEVYALQSFMYTARIVINPMERGMIYSQKSGQSIQKSLALKSSNPRAKYLKLSNEIGMADFFGQETSQYCDEVSVLLEGWDDFKPESEIHPSWGKDMVAGIVESCESSETSEETSLEETEVEASSNDLAVYSLTINIEKLPSNNGLVMLELLNENEEALANMTGKIDNYTSRIIVDGLPKGTYSIRYYHDENSNDEMDSNKWGMPIEAYGYSNNAKGKFGPPSFDLTLFEMNSDLSLSLISQ